MDLSNATRYWFFVLVLSPPLRTLLVLVLENRCIEYEYHCIEYEYEYE